MKPLFVRLPAGEAELLDEAAVATGRSKRQLVSDAVREHLAATGDSLLVGHAALRENPGEVLTPGEAAALLRVDESALKAAAGRGELPGRQLAGEWRFSREALLAWLGGADAVVPPSAPARR